MDELLKNQCNHCRRARHNASNALALGVRQICRSYFCKFVLQTLLYPPQITSLLQAQPEHRTVADEFSYSKGHFCCNRMRTSQYAMQLLTRNTESSSRFTNR